MAGAWAATLVSFAVMLFTSTITIGELMVWDFSARFSDVLPGFMLWEGKLYLPWQMILYLGSGLISGIIVSLVTRPVDREKIENFYALVRTPVTPGEQVDNPCTLPEGAVVPERRNIFPNSNIELSVPSRTSVLGFLVGWAFVAAIVMVVYMISSG